MQVNSFYRWAIVVSTAAGLVACGSDKDSNNRNPNRKPKVTVSGDKGEKKELEIVSFLSSIEKRVTKKLTKADQALGKQIDAVSASIELNKEECLKATANIPASAYPSCEGDQVVAGAADIVVTILDSKGIEHIFTAPILKGQSSAEGKALGEFEKDGKLSKVDWHVVVKYDDHTGNRFGVIVYDTPTKDLNSGDLKRWRSGPFFAFLFEKNKFGEYSPIEDINGDQFVTVEAYHATRTPHAIIERDGMEKLAAYKREQQLQREQSQLAQTERLAKEHEAKSAAGVGSAHMILATQQNPQTAAVRARGFGGATNAMQGITKEMKRQDEMNRQEALRQWFHQPVVVEPVVTEAPEVQPAPERGVNEPATAPGRMIQSNWEPSSSAAPR